MEREHTSTDLRGVVDVVMDEGRGVMNSLAMAAGMMRSRLLPIAS